MFIFGDKSKSPEKSLLLEKMICIKSNKICVSEYKLFTSWIDRRHAPRWAPTVVDSILTIDIGVRTEHELSKCKRVTQAILSSSGLSRRR